jgi:hypothetical protein
MGWGQISILELGGPMRRLEIRDLTPGAEPNPRIPECPSRRWSFEI